LLKRWYYRSHKTGEIFFADMTGELPMRRIVRGVGRVWRGEKEPSAAQAAEQPASTQVSSEDGV
ncbi:MAG TPA: excinuclease ABC subunit C, partial [Candidatus Sulfotelmatobacter sp.]|nr:excinuclease ABC subunit C [Candidatus Sulfotelmatobacter sp.]